MKTLKFKAVIKTDATEAWEPGVYALIANVDGVEVESATRFDLQEVESLGNVDGSLLSVDVDVEYRNGVALFSNPQNWQVLKSAETLAQEAETAMDDLFGWAKGLTD